MRLPRQVRVAAVVVALAVLLAAGLAGARFAIGRWGGPRSIAVGSGGADALALSPDGRTLYAANWDEDGGSGGITAVDLGTARAGKRAGIGGTAWKLTMAPGGRALYALEELGRTGDRLVRVGLPAMRAGRQVLFPNGAQDMAAAPVAPLLYVLANTSGESMAVIPLDTDSLHEGKAIPVPANSQAIAVAPDGRTLYIGTGNADGRGPGEIIPVDARDGKARIPFRFAHPVTGLAVSAGGRLFGLASSYRCGADVTCGGRCELVGIDLLTSAAMRPVPLDSGCGQVESVPGRSRLLVLSTHNSLTLVNGLTGTVQEATRTTGIGAGEGDADFLVAPDGRTAYVADQFQGVVVIPVPPASP